MIVLSIDSVINLLGHSPEPGAAVTHGYGGQLLMLEVRHTPNREVAKVPVL